MLLFRELSLSYPKVECYVFFCYRYLGGWDKNRYLRRGWVRFSFLALGASDSEHCVICVAFYLVNSFCRYQSNKTVPVRGLNCIYLCFQFLLYNVDACGMVGGSADISYVQNHTEEICVGKGLCAVREVYTVP